MIGAWLQIIQQTELRGKRNRKAEWIIPHSNHEWTENSVVKESENQLTDSARFKHLAHDPRRDGGQFKAHGISTVSVASHRRYLVSLIAIANGSQENRTVAPCRSAILSIPDQIYLYQSFYIVHFGEFPSEQGGVQDQVVKEVAVAQSNVQVAVEVTCLNKGSGLIYAWPFSCRSGGHASARRVANVGQGIAVGKGIAIGNWSSISCYPFLRNEPKGGGVKCIGHPKRRKCAFLLS